MCARHAGSFRYDSGCQFWRFHCFPAIGSHFENVQIRLINLYITKLFFRNLKSAHYYLAEGIMILSTAIKTPFS